MGFQIQSDELEKYFLLLFFIENILIFLLA